MAPDTKRIREYLQKNRILVFGLLIGIVLLLIPSGRGADAKPGETISTESERRLAGALAGMDGVGEVYVLLAGDGSRSNAYSGAVIVCEGAGDAAVRLRITETVSAFTGLGSDKIVIQKFKLLGGTE